MSKSTNEPVSAERLMSTERLSDAELAEAVAIAREYAPWYSVRSSRMAKALLQLRDDLDAVTKERNVAKAEAKGLHALVDDYEKDIVAVERERNFAMQEDVRIYGGQEGYAMQDGTTHRWYCAYAGNPPELHASGTSPLEALRAAMAAPAPTPEGSE